MTVGSWKRGAGDFGSPPSWVWLLSYWSFLSWGTHREAKERALSIWRPLLLWVISNIFLPSKFLFWLRFSYSSSPQQINFLLVPLRCSLVGVVSGGFVHSTNVETNLDRRPQSWFYHLPIFFLRFFLFYIFCLTFLFSPDVDGLLFLS